MRTTGMAVFACLLATLAAVSNAQEIDRMEPPFWWTGFVHGELQIMLHGEDIAGLGAKLSEAVGGYREMFIRFYETAEALYSGVFLCSCIL